MDAQWGSEKALLWLTLPKKTGEHFRVYLDNVWCPVS